MPSRHPIAGSLILCTVFGVAAFGDAPSAVLRAQQSPVGLFIDAPGQPARDQSNDPTVMRSRPVTIRFDALTDASAADAETVPRSTLVLNLFDDASYTAVLDRIDPAAEGFIWVGHIPGVDLSTVTLALVDTVMAGSVVMPGAVYAIRNSGGPVHEVRQIDQSKFPPELNPIPVPLPRRDGVSADAEPATAARRRVRHRCDGVVPEGSSSGERRRGAQPPRDTRRWDWECVRILSVGTYLSRNVQGESRIREFPKGITVNPKRHLRVNREHTVLSRHFRVVDQRVC